MRHKSQTLLGAFTLLCGFFMMWGSARGTARSNFTENDLRDKAVEVDALHPAGVNNGSLVLASGSLYSPRQLEDELLKPGPYLILRRHVEMFQWEELADSIERSVEYRLAWKEGQIDFFAFQNPTGHENPLLRFEAMTAQVDTAVFGAFDALAILRSVRVLLPLELTPELLKDPSLRLEGNKIYVPRAANSTEGAQLGDLRVWYEVLPQGDYTILTVQNDERNLVGSRPADGMVIRRGRYSIDAFFSAERADAGRVSTGLLYVGGIVFFFGLCSVLAPIAAKFSLRPKLEIDGMPALIFMSAFVSLVLVCIFFLLAQL